MVVPISATMVRDLMVKDNRREWQKWVNPKLHKLYLELRQELLTVTFYKNMEIHFIKEEH